MVKNTKGGNKGKKCARKHTGGDENRILRRAGEEGEVYAIVDKIMGGGICMVKCANGCRRQCIIRGKFRRGHSKSGNTVRVGVWVMVGIRDWEVRGQGDEKCDLLEVYTDIEVGRLKQLEPSNILPKEDGEDIEDDIFDRSNGDTSILEDSIKAEIDNHDLTNNETLSVLEEEEICIDEI